MSIKELKDKMTFLSGSNWRICYKISFVTWYACLCNLSLWWKKI